MKNMKTAHDTQQHTPCERTECEDLYVDVGDVAPALVTLETVDMVSEGDRGVLLRRGFPCGDALMGSGGIPSQYDGKSAPN